MKESIDRSLSLVMGWGFFFNVEQALKSKLPLCHVVPCFIETCSKASPMFSTYWFTSQVESEPNRNCFQTTYHPAFMVLWWVLIFQKIFLFKSNAQVTTYSRREVQWPQKKGGKEGGGEGEREKRNACLFIMLLSFHILRVDFCLIIYIIIDKYNSRVKPKKLGLGGVVPRFEFQPIVCFICYGFFLGFFGEEGEFLNFFCG